MKYSELISFKPIESTIQLVEGTKTEMSRVCFHSYSLACCPYKGTLLLALYRYKIQRLTRPERPESK